METAVQARFKIARGNTLVHSGERVTGFHMAGELIGLDGIAHEQHPCDAVALADTEVCAVQWDRLESLASEMSPLQRHLYATLGSAMARLRANMLSVRNAPAEVRIARVLLDLQHRLKVRGFSAMELVLRMTRQELASYLCVKHETVSRAFSKFDANGVLDVKLRQVRILDLAALQALVIPNPNPKITPSVDRRDRNWALPTHAPVWRMPHSAVHPTAFLFPCH